MNDPGLGCIFCDISKLAIILLWARDACFILHVFVILCVCICLCIDSSHSTNSYFRIE